VEVDELLATEECVLTLEPVGMEELLLPESQPLNPTAYAKMNIAVWGFILAINYLTDSLDLFYQNVYFTRKKKPSTATGLLG
jgi:hypothetical protein